MDEIVKPVEAAVEAAQTLVERRVSGTTLRAGFKECRRGAAEGAVESFTMSAALELADHGVTADVASNQSPTPAGSPTTTGNGCGS